MSATWLREDPKVMAAEVARAAQDNPAWVAAFISEFEAQARADQLPRVLRVWGLSATEAAGIFGVSRQAFAKWARAGVPSERLGAVGDLAAATDLLVHYLKPERIPAVVRRPAEAFGGRSLLDVAATGDTPAVLAWCRAMFDFSAVGV